MKRGSLTPQTEILMLTFKLYRGKYEKAHKQKYQMLTKVNQPASMTVLLRLKDHSVPASNVVRRALDPGLL